MASNRIAAADEAARSEAKLGLQADHSDPPYSGNSAIQTSAQTQAQPDDQVEPYDVTILICSTCREADGSDQRPTPGETLAAAVHSAHAADQSPEAKSITIASIECLGNCKRRLSASLVTPGCWSYVFGDLAVSNAADLIAGAKLMRHSPNGLMPWRDRPQCLKTGMVARIPPLKSPLLK